MIKVKAHIMISSGATVIFLMSYRLMQNSIIPNGSPRSAMISCLGSILILKPNSFGVIPTIFAIITLVMNKGTLIAIIPKASGIPVSGRDTLIILIRGIRIRAEYSGWQGSLFFIIAIIKSDISMVR